MPNDRRPERLTADLPASDGALLIELARCNKRARNATGAEATAYEQAGQRVWERLVRKPCGRLPDGAHVNIFYDLVLAALRLPPSNPFSLEAERSPGDDAVGRAFAGYPVRTIPYELTRAFFDSLRWLPGCENLVEGDETGDEKFHDYLDASAERVVLAYKRRVGLFSGSPPIAPSPHGRERVDEALHDAMLTRPALEALVRSPLLRAKERVTLERHLAIPSAEAPKIAATALDRVFTFRGYVPPLEPLAEAFVGPLLRPKGARSATWPLPWATWCAQLDAEAAREIFRQYLRHENALRGGVIPDDEAECAVDKLVGSFQADQLGVAAFHSLPGALVHLIDVLTAGLARLPQMRHPERQGVVEDYLAGLTPRDIARGRRISVGLVYQHHHLAGEWVQRQLATSPPRPLFPPPSPPTRGPDD